MTTHIGIGFSSNLDSEVAARQAAMEAKKNIHSNQADFAMVFTTVHYDFEKSLTVINKVLGHPKLIGSSTAGLILTNSIETQGITVVVFSSEDIKFGISCIENIEQDTLQNIGKRLSQESIREMGAHARQTFLFFMDDKLRNSSPFLKGLQETFGNIFSFAGAGSSDDFHFNQSFQIYKNQILKGSIVGVLIGGQVAVGVAGRHGWRPLGKPRILDEVDGNIMRKIDGKNAATLYEEYFEDQAREIKSHKLGHMSILYPLGIYSEESNQYLLRNAVDIQDDGSIICQGDMPAGTEVHIMIGNKESCKQAAVEAAEEAQRNLLGKKAKLVIIMECLSRLKLLGRNAPEEIQKIKEIFGADVPIVGMYSNGEICPFETSEVHKKTVHQNESIVILALA